MTPQEYPGSPDVSFVQFRIERGASVLGRDGLLGTVEQIVVDRDTGALRAIVVRSIDTLTEFELPADHVERATGEHVYLDIGRVDLAANPQLATPYNPDQYVPVYQGTSHPPSTASQMAIDTEAPVITEVEENAAALIAPRTPTGERAPTATRQDELSSELTMAAESEQEPPEQEVAAAPSHVTTGEVPTAAAATPEDSSELTASTFMEELEAREAAMSLASPGTAISGDEVEPLEAAAEAELPAMSESPLVSEADLAVWLVPGILLAGLGVGALIGMARRQRQRRSIAERLKQASTQAMKKTGRTRRTGGGMASRIVALACGLCAGAGLAIFYAPKRGADLRSLLADRLEQWTQSAA